MDNRASASSSVTSALVFALTGYLIKEIFRADEPDWISTKPVIEAEWNACLQDIRRLWQLDSVSRLLTGWPAARIRLGRYDDQDLGSHVRAIPLDVKRP